jgi:hypothetical protein
MDLARVRRLAQLSRYAAATMFTLFFAGNEYAPDVSIDGEPAQDYLQEKYIAAMRHAYRRLKDCRAIAGWGPLHEPDPGFIGYADLSQLENSAVPPEAAPTAFQSMAAASGHAEKTGEAALNPEKMTLYREGFECPWKLSGVWTDEGGVPRLLRPGHFSRCRGLPVSFADDFLKPFLKRFAAVLREVRSDSLMFIEGGPQGGPPSWSAEDGGGFVNVIRRHRGAQGDSVDERMGGMPSLLCEFGLPGDDSAREEALAEHFDAADENLLHAAIGNYAAPSADERAMAIDGLRRPYPVATAGVPLYLRWDRHARKLEYRFRADPAVSAPTEVFAPAACFGGSPRVSVEPACGAATAYDEAASRLSVRFEGFEGEASIFIEEG